MPPRVQRVAAIRVPCRDHFGSAHCVSGDAARDHADRGAIGAHAREHRRRRHELHRDHLAVRARVHRRESRAVRQPRNAPSFSR